jgi:GABA permease
MAHYLIVAHQTAGISELLEQVQRTMREDPASEITLLVPATPVDHLLHWTEGESVEIARRQAESACARLEAEGANMRRALVGDASPLQAIADELSERPESYDAMIICTLPLGLSSWLKLDAVNQARRRFGLPVTHVTAEAVGAAARA